MKKITHHLTDELLMAYSAGTLPEAFGLVVATHISLCDECRARLGGFDAVGGAMLEQEDSVAMAEDSLEATLARIAKQAPEKPVRPVRPGIFPGPLRDKVGGDKDAVQWRSVGGGVKQAILPTPRSASLRLLRIPAGEAVPDHGHNGLELTLVLQGGFRDESGEFWRGDVEVASDDLEHTPVALPGTDCICLAATDAPLRFKALLPRLAQPFLKI